MRQHTPRLPAELLHEEDEQHDKQRRRQHLAHAVDDLIRIQREIVRSRKEDRRIDELPERNVFLREEGAYADLERDGSRTRHGKERADDEVEDDEQHRCEERPRLGAQQRHILAARKRNRRNAEERQTDACRHKAQHGEQRILARGLSERRGEDEIACAEVDGEHHKAERQEVFLF